MNELLFGTNNAHKLEEICLIIGDRFAVHSLKDLDLRLDPEETEDTLKGNALLKARAFHRASGLPCFADDTGLMVEALNGRPGVYSARYAGEQATYQDNVRKLLLEMEPHSQRQAYFATVIAFVDGEKEWTFEGRVEGVITEQPMGQGGFGYDPVFRPEGKVQTFAQMDPKAKHAISHRGRAVRKFADFLAENY